MGPSFKPIFLFALGVMLIVEGLFLNVLGVIINDGSFMVEGAFSVFIGALLFGLGRSLDRVSQNQ